LDQFERDKQGRRLDAGARTGRKTAHTFAVRALAIAAIIGAAAAPAGAQAAERKAVIQGVGDNALRQAIEQAVGEDRAPPENRLEARRRARDAAENALALLRSEGYYAGTVEPDIGEGEQPTPVVRVEPGPRFSFGASEVEWVGTAPTAEADRAAQAALSLPQGAPGRAVEVLAAEGRVVGALQEYGYADAVAAPRRVVVDHADRSVSPTFNISSGGQVELGGIRLESQGRTRAAWVDYLMPWEPGEVYRPSVVAELERRLLDAGVYDQVTVALSSETDPQGRRPVLVSLADRGRRLLEVSAGYSTTEGGDIDLRWSHFNTFGRADTLAFQARYAELGSRLGVDLTLPHWRHPGRTLRLTAEAFRDTTDAFDQTGGALRADLTRRWGRTSYFTRGVALIRSRVNDHHTGPMDLVMGKLLVALVLDRTDNPLDPTRGWKAEARIEPTALTGDQGLFYTRSQIQGSTYFALDRAGRTVLAGRLRLGSIVGGRLASVPAAERFYAGGGGSVRGYGYQKVGPRYDDGDPQGGLSLVEASFEVRQKVGRKFGAVVFVDAGSVGQAVNPNFGASLAAGVGVRYNLDFAPIRVDFAVPFNRPRGDSPFQVYVSIGQSF
jgi:translocation and assembly module TamA